MSKPVILVLGGTGFIGNNCANYLGLEKGYTVTYPISRTYDLTKRDDVDRLFLESKPDIVIHCAAKTTNSKDVVLAPWNHVTDNTLMNALVFEACHRYKVKHCIFMSCSVMYQPKDKPQTELDWNPGDEIYPAYFGVGNMKVYSEKLCEFYSRLGKCKYTVIRNSNVFGPHDKFEINKCHMLPALVMKVVDATDSIEVWGDPVNQAKRDIIYVDDVVSLVDKIIEKQTTPFERFNCGQGKAYSVSDIVNLVQKAVGKNLKITYNTSKPNIPTTVILDCEKAKKLLGWEPKTSIEEGLKKTVEWYKQNL
jgi:GDP-L-fucose synthase